MLKTFPRKRHNRNFKNITKFRSVLKTYSPVTQLAVSVSLAIIVFGLPLAYVLNQNYSAFINLSFQHDPSLIRQIEREQLWTNIFLVSGAIILLCTNIYIMWRYIKDFSDTTQNLISHLRRLNKGDWSTKEEMVTENENYDSLMAHYDYFVKTLHAQTLTEIRQLEKLIVDPKNRESYAIWEQILKSKRARLGFEEVANENLAAAASIHHWRKSA